jgi:hypothetical protein
MEGCWVRADQHYHQHIPDLKRRVYYDITPFDHKC